MSGYEEEESIVGRVGTRETHGFTQFRPHDEVKTYFLLFLYYMWETSITRALDVAGASRTGLR